MLLAFFCFFLPLAVIFCSKKGGSDKSNPPSNSNSGRQAAAVERPSPATSGENVPRRQAPKREHLSAMDAHMDTSHEAFGPRKSVDESKAKGGSDEEKKEEKEEKEETKKHSKKEAKQLKKSVELTKSCDKVTVVQTKETMASPIQSRADGQSISARPKSDEWFSKKQPMLVKQKSDNADETQLPTTQTEES